MSEPMSPGQMKLADENRLLRKENDRLQRAVDELSTLNDIAAAISSTSSLQSVVNLLIEKCVKHLRVEQAAVQLFDEARTNKAKTVVRRFQSDFHGVPLRLNDQIAGWMQTHSKPLLVSDLANDSRFQLPQKDDLEIRSLLCVPLRLHGRLFGILSVFNKRREEKFSDADLRLLLIIASQSAQVIENTRLYEEEAKLNRMQHELQTAKEIQLGLLPAESPSILGYEIAGLSQPAQLVGGDYFDYLPGGDNRIGLCLGDVAGKGLPAALLMANLQATIRGQTQPESSAAVQVGLSNTLLSRSIGSNKFVTLFYGLLDHDKHTLEYCSAGHNPALLFSESEEPRKLETGGLVLGIMPNYDYMQEEVELQAGELVVVYSDGISEAVNRDGEEFGEEGLCRLVHSHREDSAQRLVKRVFQAVKDFCGETPQADDMTIMAIRRTPA